MTNYIHDSESKQAVRNKWVEFINEIKTEDPLTIVTLPSSEIQELLLYAENDIIKAEFENNKLYIEEGNVFCFEIKQKRYVELIDKVVGGTTLNNDISSHLREIRATVLNNKTGKALPLDVLNLDFEGSLDKLKIPLEETIDNVLVCQAHHNKRFANFITFPFTNDTDSDAYKEKINSVIETNLSDPNNTSFTEQYNAKVESGNLDEEVKNIIAVLKLIFKCSSHYNFNCVKSNVIVYGDKEMGEGCRKRMISFLFHFYPSTGEVSHTEIYYQDILKAFDEYQYL